MLPKLIFTPILRIDGLYSVLLYKLLYSSYQINRQNKLYTSCCSACFFFYSEIKQQKQKNIWKGRQKYKISHPQINAILLEKRFDLDDFRLNQKVFWQIVLSKNGYIKRNHFRIVLERRVCVYIDCFNLYQINEIFYWRKKKGVVLRSLY